MIDSAATQTVLIAGGGIGGMTLALTLHQIGVPCVVYEAVAELQPLGVGINLQPNAVRELYDLGIDERRARHASASRPANGRWSAATATTSTPSRAACSPAIAGRSTRCIAASCRCCCTARCSSGSAPMRSVWAIASPATATAPMASRRWSRRATASASKCDGTLLVAADGLHSAVRAQMHPDQPPIQWGGAIMWRGTTPGVPIRTGASFVGVGSLASTAWCSIRSRRPIRAPAWPPSTGSPRSRSTTRRAGRQGDWNRRASLEDFIHHFDGWNYGWLDVPAMLRGANEVFEYPMIDRDPVPTWVDGHVALLGDAAHVMYPVGSNGASQAIVDARVLGAAMVAHGVEPAALRAYDDKLCADISALVLRNRGAGPFGILGLVDERCGGVFDDIDDVIPAAEREAFMARYKAAAGFAIETLNAAPPTIAPGARVT